MEVPPAVADDAAHRDGRVAVVVCDVAAVPAALEGGGRLGGCFGGEAACGAEVEVGGDWGVARVEGVAGGKSDVGGLFSC